MTLELLTRPFENLKLANHLKPLCKNPKRRFRIIGSSLGDSGSDQIDRDLESLEGDVRIFAPMVFTGYSAIMYRLHRLIERELVL